MEIIHGKSVRLFRVVPSLRAMQEIRCHEGPGDGDASPLGNPNLARAKAELFFVK